MFTIYIANILLHEELDFYKNSIAIKSHTNTCLICQEEVIIPITKAFENNIKRTFSLYNNTKLNYLYDDGDYIYPTHKITDFSWVYHLNCLEAAKIFPDSKIDIYKELEL